MRLGLTKQVLREVWPDEAPICLPHETPMFREAKPHETSSWLPHETPVLREAFMGRPGMLLFAGCWPAREQPTWPHETPMSREADVS